ncbi:hypothetical protein H5410_001111 [Solanum commersonii]|uniref:Uncharacterized protein n=1 Tax=Solanum commersonii TaxID=4109 RepID=A0A9J6AYN4_SOLCO|nr:hypothetical protein H5410_001111 [Solanum commersonii]
MESKLIDNSIDVNLGYPAHIMKGTLKTGRRTGTGWIDRFVDRYRDEPDRNYRDGCSVPSRPTIYRDGTGTDRNGTGWDKRDDTSRI